jgi:hypothetical protein
VTTANVCRISGKLPNAGCDHVEVVNRDGTIETRSMIYTEYFLKGTQPTTVCPLHEPRSFMDAIAGVFGKDSGPPPLPVGASGLPMPAPPERAHGAPASAEPAATATTSPAPGEEASAPKKRGFWSRVFGGGGDKSEEDRKKEEERRKQEQKKEEERKRKSGGR